VKPLLALLLATTLAQAQPVIPMQPVDSTAISAVGYDEASQRLRIVFIQGKAYDFCAVPKSVFKALVNAVSKGKFYNNAIKDKYTCD
jgi:KTSC domain